MSATTRFNNPVLPDPPALYLAFDLSNRSWKLAFSSGLGQRARIRTIPARDLQALTAEIKSARIRLIEKIQTERLESSSDPALALVRQLMTIKAVGLQSAWLFTFEFFAWRNIQNRRQLAALCVFTPTPYQSGDESPDQGISKAGSSLVRAMAIQIAWGWLHFQPDSALTLWFQTRFADGGRRMRAIGIVALARRLIIELWRFLETGSLPEGAVTSPS